MSHVPLIPFQRPVPQVFLRPESLPKSAKTALPNKQKKAKMVSTKKKTRFEATNTDDIKRMPADVQRLWRILERQDPDGEVFVNDKGIILIDGEGPEDRTPEALGLRKEDTELLRSYSVLDGPKANDPETATGLLFTQYQMIQLAYELGRQAEQRKVAKDFRAMTAISPPPPSPTAEADDYGEEEDEDENEEFDDDEMDVVEEDGNDNESGEEDVEEDL
jgi:hypothetical protein